MPAHAKFSSRAAPVETPLPLWILYPLFFVAVYLTHFTLLRLPWFWDEAGYYIPAALDFFRTGSLIPHSTITNAHPPLPSILLASWWRLCGYHIAATRTFLCMFGAAAFLGVFRLVRQLAGTPAAAAVTLLTAIYPVWFAQSTLAHADLFAGAFTVWALSFALGRFSSSGFSSSGFSDPIPAAALFTLAALSKETAIVTPLALALWECTLLLTRRKPLEENLVSDVRHGLAAQPQISWLVAFLFPLLPLIAWYAFHRHVTGFTFGNPEFLRYNATANLAPARVLLSLWHRVTHLAFHLNLWVPLALTAALLLPGRTGRRSSLVQPALNTIAVVLLANTLAFSVLGGALLTRYLLPLYPLVLLLYVSVWQTRFRRWPVLVALTAAGFAAALWINPPYAFAPEDNLTYSDFVVLHQQAIRVLAQRYPAATVLTAWPATAELRSPDLGYAPHPFATDAIDNFSAAEISKAAADPGAFDTALIFSTKWVPPPGRFSFGRLSERTDTKFYDFHRDLSPQEVATLLHGQVVWQGSRDGEWAAVLHFSRIVEARAEPPKRIF